MIVSLEVLPSGGKLLVSSLLEERVCAITGTESLDDICDMLKARANNKSFPTGMREVFAGKADKYKKFKVITEESLVMKDERAQYIKEHGMYGI